MMYRKKEKKKEKKIKPLKTKTNKVYNTSATHPLEVNYILNKTQTSPIMFHKPPTYGLRDFFSTYFLRIGRELEITSSPQHQRSRPGVGVDESSSGSDTETETSEMREEQVSDLSDFEEVFRADDLKQRDGEDDDAEEGGIGMLSATTPVPLAEEGEEEGEIVPRRRDISKEDEGEVGDTGGTSSPGYRPKPFHLSAMKSILEETGSAAVIGSTTPTVLVGVQQMEQRRQHRRIPRSPDRPLPDIPGSSEREQLEKKRKKGKKLKKKVRGGLWKVFSSNASSGMDDFDALVAGLPEGSRRRKPSPPSRSRQHQEQMIQTPIKLRPAVITSPGGKLGLMMCPGRVRKVWRRSLEPDLERARGVYHVDVVVPHVRDEEFLKMGFSREVYFEALHQHGIETYHYPIRDKWLPHGTSRLCMTIAYIIDCLHEGKNVVVHCNGGKGRSGLVAVCVLIALGYGARKAIKRVKKSRSGTLRNPLQIAYAFKFWGKWKHFLKKNLLTRSRLRMGALKEYLKRLKEEEEDGEVSEQLGGFRDIRKSAARISPEILGVGPRDDHSTKLALFALRANEGPKFVKSGVEVTPSVFQRMDVTLDDPRIDWKKEGRSNKTRTDWQWYKARMYGPGAGLMSWKDRQERLLEMLERGKIPVFLQSAQETTPPEGEEEGAPASSSVGLPPPAAAAAAAVSSEDSEADASSGEEEVVVVGSDDENDDDEGEEGEDVEDDEN